MKILIIDDDIVFSKTFKKDIYDFFIQYNDQVNIDIINFHFSDLSIYKRYDIIFVDIELPNTNGILLSKTLKRQNPTSIFVFVSAKSNLIHSSLTVQPFFFIRKNNYSQDISLFFQLFQDAISDNAVIQLSYKTTKVTVPLQNIIYIEATQHILNIYTQDNVYKDNRSLKTIIKDIPSHYFIQIHRSFIINCHYVCSFSRGTVHLFKAYHDNIKTQYTTLSISRSYQKYFEEKYQEFLLLWQFL